MSEAESSRVWGPGTERRTGGWCLTPTRDGLLLATAVGDERFDGLEARRVSVRRRWFRLVLVVSGNPERSFGGLTRGDAQEIRAAVAGYVARAELAPLLNRAGEFRDALDGLIAAYVAQGRWIPHERAAALLGSRPNVVLPDGLASAFITREERDALDLLAGGASVVIQAANARILADESFHARQLLNRAEKSPLTDEQIRAVVTLDNRVRVIAAAGSGKTSVMVARAAYAIARGFVPPDRILLLAFNADAAAELQQRVTSRLHTLGLPSGGVRASTFHSFGLSLIGQATGRKPSIAPWVESGRDLAKVSEIIDQLRDASEGFRFRWDLFRLLYGRMSDDLDGGEPDSYDRARRVTGFGTYRGETVRSEGERLIADWLFLNGVDYRYEQPYSHDVADGTHAQYRPDFYYPQIDVWHEHWALGADGKPPAAFVGYEDSIRWKKSIHRSYGTDLIETTWHDILSHHGFPTLADDLRHHGAQLDWNPDRTIPGAAPIDHERLVGLMRTFLSHVKTNSLTRQDLTDRLAAKPSRRSDLFLELFWGIHDRWEAELRAAQVIDFDDMLTQAANLLERDPSLSGYRMILVDEFQDTSRSRARLVRALTSGPEKYLLAVGDDWQAINRFAGADIAAMTHFDQYFGAAQTLYLQTTFRNPQPIADVASRFVSRNPAQLTKHVTASHRGSGPLVTVVRVKNRDSIPRAIEKHLADLAAAAPGSSVDVLGRYHRERQFMPRRRFDGLNVQFRTVHSAKGLEADFVLLPNLTTGTYGFPSQIEDDPVLKLVLAGNDDYPHAEERRLFYVALTRARRAVTIFTAEGVESPFVVELLRDPGVRLQDSTGSPTAARVCSACGQGTMVLRRGPYGEFLGCSRFPKCTHKERIQTSWAGGSEPTGSGALA